MAATIARCRVAAERSDATVLITGPTGVGKELLAQGLHNASRRRRHPFLAVNCGALPETLLETELFGYEEGAFTGARRNGKAGLFEAANEGTVFLDEVAEMPPLLQTRLLRVLQEREVTRVGGTDTLHVNVRIVAATHRDLWQRVREGAFRQDLFYRLSVLRVQVPPLRERPEDRDILATALVSAAMRRAQLDDLLEAVLPTAVYVAKHHSWPGNVRELENFAERVAMACIEAGAAVPASQLAALLDRDQDQGDSPAATVMPPDSTLSGMTIASVKVVLDECGGNRTLAAKRLGIGRSTLWRLLKNVTARSLPSVR
jgi:propionate catabolism operon transcriptional regulator